MRHLLVLFVFVLLPACAAWAQMERTVYQIFPADSARSIRLDLVGQYELIPWAGDNVLAETHIQIWNASPEILDYLIEKERYTIDTLRTGDAFQLTSKVKDRKTIKNRDRQDCHEVVGLKLFVPDYYGWPEASAATELTIKDQ
jgi:hypothetical protein